MNGDFSRDTFDPAMNFSRVLMQQGRVHVDADWNEQVSILLHHLRAFAADVIGPFGGPVDPVTGEVEAFRVGDVERDPDYRVIDFPIGPGRYYVDGFLCESPPGSTYEGQDGNPEPPGLPALVYLDVWERHLTFLEQPSIREVALDGPDTASRARVVSQVRLAQPPEGFGLGSDDVIPRWHEWTRLWQWPERGCLSAWAQTGQAMDDPCIEPPTSRYRGPENQLYRVEIHRGGQASIEGIGGGATFKWSRENASVAFAIETVTIDDEATSTTIMLEDLGRDVRFGLEVGDWVEIEDEDSVIRGDTRSLLEIREIDRPARSLVLDGVPTVSPDVTEDPDAWKNPILRRWDHREAGNLPLDDGAIPIREGEAVDLEDGIRIEFEGGEPAARYRTGDFWLIPARVATGDVEWPRDAEGPTCQPPRGVDHHYAPLAVINADGNLVEPLLLRSIRQVAE
jgi:hypothetical protein